MAAKPTVADSRWATDETNNTAPSGGQRDTGWTPNQIAVSDYFNVLAFEAYSWFLYLSDGDLVGDHSITGALDVSGAVDFGDDLNVDGDVTIGGSLTGDLDVTGALTAVSVSGSDYVTTTEGDIRHGEVTMQVPLIVDKFDAIGSPTDYYVPEVAGVLSTGRSYLTSYNGDDAVFAVHLPMKVGDRIKKITAIVTSNEGGRQVNMASWKHALSGAFASVAATQLGTTQSSGSSANFQTIEITGLTETVAAATVYQCHFTIDGGGGSHRVYGLWVTYDRVA